MALVDNAWYVNFGNGSSTGYYAVTAWATGVTKVCGNLIRQATTPAVGSERVFVCVASISGTGTTGGAEPTWTVTRGAKNTDNTVTWQEATGIAALNGDLSANTPTWATVKNTAVTLGQVIQNVAGTLILICTTAGTAGNGSEPSWAAFTNAGATTADNTVTWTTLGASFSKWAAPHARIGNAVASTWGQANNSFFVGDNHAETQASANTIVLPGLSATPNFVCCVNHSGSVPPASTDVTTGGSITTTGNNNIAIVGFGVFSGLTFAAGSGAVNAKLTLGSSANNHQVFYNCALQKNGTTAISTAITTAASSVDLYNTTMQFGATGDALSAATGCLFRWFNTPSAIQGSTIPTGFINFSSAAASYYLDGIDLSAITGTLVSPVGALNDIVFSRCKLAAGVTISGAQALAGVVIDLIQTDSGATNYRTERYQYAATQTTETTVVRTGGATDGTTPVSWKIVTTANSKWIQPFTSLPMAVWNNTTGSTVNVTVYGIWGGGAVPNNDDIWIEVDYMSSSLTPVSSIATTTKNNNLATGTANSSDSSTWGGSTTAFKMSVAITPQMAGPISVVVKAAKLSSTFYIDPLIVLS